MTPADATAHLVDPRRTRALDVLGPTIQYMTEVGQADGEPCVMRGTVPPGASVPLHSHTDPETFVGLSGHVEALVDGPGGPSWIGIGPRDVFHVPGGARHAFRNRSDEPAVMIVVSTARMGRFFREVGTPADQATAAASPPSGAAVQRFVQAAERYGHWLAGPEENAEVGLNLG
jgi:quercetin dioxygenase-like cupin family protein